MVVWAGRVKPGLSNLFHVLSGNILVLEETLDLSHGFLERGVLRRILLKARTVPLLLGLSCHIKLLFVCEIYWFLLKVPVRIGISQTHLGLV